MSERSKNIFGNPMTDSVYRKAVRSREKYKRKFGDDTDADYPVTITKNPYIGDLLGVMNLNVEKEGSQRKTDIWASDITEFPWQLHRLPIPWAMCLTGWT